MENQTTFNSISEQKTFYREQLRHKRSRIPLSRRLLATHSACSCLLDLSRNHSLVLSYASFGSELDMWGINRQLAKEKGLVLPKIDQKELRLFKVEDLSYLSMNQWQILEPDPQKCKEVNPQDVSMAFIPGLGFETTSKHRLGYGKGFYDRLLNKMKDTTCLGIGFLEQIVPTLPIACHDYSLDEQYFF